MFKVLFTGNTLSTERIDQLKLEGIEIIPAPATLNEQQLAKALTDIQGYICGGDEIATRFVLESASKLKIFAFLGTGYSRFVDSQAALEKGIIITNTPGANAAAVAEFTVALLLSSLKQIVNLHNKTKSGAWEKHSSWLLKGKKIGIIGMGAIGSKVARTMHHGFGMEVLYVSRNQKPEIESELSATKVDLDTLLRDSDIVSLHVALNADTTKMLGKREFSLMKPTAILINADRAEVVDGHALYEAITSGKIARAAFDVYYKEPIPSLDQDEYKLLGLPDDQFILTPHTAHSSPEANLAMEEMCIRQIKAVAEGKTPENMVRE